MLDKPSRDGWFKRHGRHFFTDGKGQVPFGYVDKHIVGSLFLLFWFKFTSLPASSIDDDVDDDDYDDYLCGKQFGLVSSQTKRYV